MAWDILGQQNLRIIEHPDNWGRTVFDEDDPEGPVLTHSHRDDVLSISLGDEDDSRTVLLPNDVSLKVSPGGEVVRVTIRGFRRCDWFPDPIDDAHWREAARQERPAAYLLRTGGAACARRLADRLARTAAPWASCYSLHLLGQLLAEAPII